MIETIRGLQDAGVEPLQFGMSGSPLVYDNVVVVNPGVGLESGFDGELNSRFIERNHAVVAFADGKGLALKRVELRQAKLAVNLFV